MVQSAAVPHSDACRHHDNTVTATSLSAYTCASVCGASSAVCQRWPRVSQSAARSHDGLDTATPLSLPLRRLPSHLPLSVHCPVSVEPAAQCLESGHECRSRLHGCTLVSTPSLPLHCQPPHVPLSVESALQCVNGGHECRTRLHARTPVSTPRHHRHCRSVATLVTTPTPPSPPFHCRPPHVPSGSAARRSRHRDTTVTATRPSVFTFVIVCGARSLVCRQWPRVVQSAARWCTGLGTDTTTITIPSSRWS